MSSVEVTRSAPRSQRQEHILDSAETCFVRSGFHRATMVEIAREAGMSQGNFYRYYVSKEALILDIAEREAERAGALVADLVDQADRRAAVMAVLTRYFADITRKSAILRLDLWAEATRNAEIATLIARQEEEARVWILDSLATIASTSKVDRKRTWVAISTILKGMIVNRALFDAYDPNADLGRLEGFME